MTPARHNGLLARLKQGARTDGFFAPVFSYGKRPAERMRQKPPSNKASRDDANDAISAAPKESRHASRPRFQVQNAPGMTR